MNGVVIGLLIAAWLASGPLIGYVIVAVLNRREARQEAQTESARELALVQAALTERVNGKEWHG